MRDWIGIILCGIALCVIYAAIVWGAWLVHPVLGCIIIGIELFIAGSALSDKI